MRAIAQVVVVGGGAAGLCAAHFAAEEGARVLVLERMKQCGTKILMSGGTRCNIAPMEVNLETDFFSDASRSALRAAFSSWDLDSCLAWIQSALKLQIKADPDTRKWFPATDSARDARNALQAACERSGAAIRTNASVSSITGVDAPRHRWRVALEDGSTVEARSVVIAAGGMSCPAVGTDGAALSLAQTLGHTAVPPYPALTPLLGAHPGPEPLPGLTLPDVRLSCTPPRKDAGPGGGKKKKKPKAVEAARTGFLFTHKGYSGPSVLDLSQNFTREDAGEGAVLRVSWDGATRDEWATRLSPARHGGRDVAQVLKLHLPSRLATAVAAAAGLGDGRGQPLAGLSKGSRNALLDALAAYELPVTGHAGYTKAEVTGGGVPLTELHLPSFESRMAPGVFLCGEVVDIHGRIGGFNFYHAWVSGRAAGLGAASAAAQVSEGGARGAEGAAAAG
ncbi:unnamed protein product [Pedinophyceae sp. YPF-701]|nr:unnamed protein product [Pedinophyceae sp. YPF-701]